MGLSAGLIDGLLLLPQDYRSSSPGGEGNSSEQGERERERGEGTERMQDRDRRSEWCGRQGGAVCMKMEGMIGEGRGNGGRENSTRTRRARWRQRGGRDKQMCW